MSDSVGRTGKQNVQNSIPGCAEGNVQGERRKILEFESKVRLNLAAAFGHEKRGTWSRWSLAAQSQQANNLSSEAVHNIPLSPTPMNG